MAQFFTYTVSNGLATQGGELFYGSFTLFVQKFTKVTELGKLPLKGTNDTVELFELQLLDPRKSIIVSDFVEQVAPFLSQVTNYTVANGRVYGGEIIYLNNQTLSAIEVLGVTLDEEKLVEVKDALDNTVAIITLTDWNNMSSGPIMV